MGLGETGGAARCGQAAKSPNVATALVAIAAFLLFGLNNTVTIALPSHLMGLGTGPFVAGLQNSLFVLVAVLLRVLLERTVARRGSRLSLMVGAIGYTAPCLLLAGCAEPQGIVALRIAQAIGLALFQPGVAQYLAAISPASSLGRRLGIVRFATTASLMAGPAILLPIINLHGYQAFFGALALAGACGTVAACALPKDPTGKTAPRRLRAADQTLPRRQTALLFACPLLLASGYSVIMNFGHTLAGQRLAESADGLLFACLSAGGLAGSVAAGWATDACGAKRSTAGAMALSGAGLLLMAVGGKPASVLAGALLSGAGYFGATATLVAAAGLLSSGNANALLARQQSALDLGMICGGFAAGALLQGDVPLSATFLAASVASGAALGAWSMMYPGQEERD